MSSNTVTIEGRKYWTVEGESLLTGAKEVQRTLRHRASRVHKATMKLHLFTRVVAAVYPAKLYLFMYLHRAERAIQRQADRVPMYLWGLALLSLAYAGQVAATAMRVGRRARTLVGVACSFLSSDGFHKTARKYSTTAVYVLGTVMLAGTLPKIMMVVWSL